MSFDRGSGVNVNRFQSGAGKYGSLLSQNEKKPRSFKSNSVHSVVDLDDELPDSTNVGIRASRVLGPIHAEVGREQNEVSNSIAKADGRLLQEPGESRKKVSISSAELRRPSFDNFAHRAPVKEFGGGRRKLCADEVGGMKEQEQQKQGSEDWRQVKGGKEGKRITISIRGPRSEGTICNSEKEVNFKRARTTLENSEDIVDSVNVTDGLKQELRDGSTNLSDNEEEEEGLLAGRVVKKAKIGKRRVVLDDSDEEEEGGTEKHYDSAPCKKVQKDDQGGRCGHVPVVECIISQERRHSNNRQASEREGGGMSVKQFGKGTSKEEWPTREKSVLNHAVVELGDEGEHEDEGDEEDADNEEDTDPVQGVLLTCEGISLRLRELLCSSISSSVEPQLDCFSEVEPSSQANLVSQADVNKACGEDNVQLKPYQLVGVNFLLLLFRQNVGGAILADEMGLGKTVQAITFLALVSHMEKDSRPHLVVAPASLLENWQRELQRWCPAFRVVLYHGSARSSIRHSYAASAQEPDFDVLLTCYSLFERDSQAQRDDRRFLRKFPYSCIVMDEAHLLKDRSTMRTKRLRDFAERARHRLMLTGTPLQNDLQELWSLLEFLMPKIFTTKGQDLSKYLGSREDPAQDDLILRVKGILEPFIIRRIKADVMKQLVAKTHKVEFVDMVREQAEAYKEAVEGYRQKVEAKAASMELASRFSVEGILPKRQIANIFVHLRKLANHPLLIRRLYTDETLKSMARILHLQNYFGTECNEQRVLDEIQEYSDYRLHQLCLSCGGSLLSKVLPQEALLTSGKCQALAELLPKLKREGQRVLIFSQWTQMLDVLEAVLETLALRFTRLDGKTEIVERQSLVDAFNSDENIFAFLLSTRAGGQGLNLTGANTVVLHDVDFNPQVDRQAEDRCHRIGQTRPVTVYRLVSRGSVDESILKIAQRKLTLDAAVLETEGDSKSMGQILAALLQGSDS